MSENLKCLWKGCDIGEFTDADSLYTHLTHQHIGRKVKGNLCLECKWGDCTIKTTKRDHITSHLRVHVPLKPHVCQYCSKSFKRPQDLKKHEKKHTETLQGSDINDSEPKNSPPIPTTIENPPSFYPTISMESSISTLNLTKPKPSTLSQPMNPVAPFGKFSDFRAYLAKSRIPTSLDSMRDTKNKKRSLAPPSGYGDPRDAFIRDSRPGFKKAKTFNDKLSSINYRLDLFGSQETLREENNTTLRNPSPLSINQHGPIRGITRDDSAISKKYSLSSIINYDSNTPSRNTHTSPRSIFDIDIHNRIPASLNHSSMENPSNDSPFLNSGNSAAPGNNPYNIHAYGLQKSGSQTSEGNNRSPYNQSSEFSKSFSANLGLSSISLPPISTITSKIEKMWPRNSSMDSKKSL
ncbi:pH-response transcription factor pacC/RIM101 [Smittium mucronatum]|uniref:pH-response transcription factor pacC/RIM101 n=1 Tax=Smittium mucronatum TaxID=133383 RepID=A0A1R0GYU9_9FUNG|nr:pH-response transcription factor pacC/RIM101 [Smittium mucronatum]